MSSSVTSLPRQRERLCTALNTLRQEEKLCDVTISCSNQTFRAHKNVLAASSQFFFDAILLGTKAKGEQNSIIEVIPETPESELKIIIQELSPTAVHALVEFMYTGYLEVRKDNVEEMLQASHILKLGEAYDYCCTLLTNRLSSGTYRFVWNLADEYDDQALCQTILDYATSNFVLLSRQDEFGKLSLDQLRKLLKSNDKSKQEDPEAPEEYDKILEAIITWVKVDRSRESHLKELLRFVSFEYLSRHYLQVLVENEPILWEWPDLMRHITQTVCTRYLYGETSSEGRSSEGRSSSYNSDCSDTSLTWEEVIAVLGESENKQVIVQCYGLTSMDFYPPHKLQPKLTHMAVVAYDDNIYLIGGKSGATHLRSVTVYSLPDGKTKAVHALNTSRSHAGAAELNGNIYVVGGHNTNGFLSSVECYSVSRDQWHQKAPLRVARGGPGVVGFGNRLFAIGGRAGDSVAPLATVECYDPKTDQWTLLPQLPFPRSHCGVCVYAGKIHVSGGYVAPDIPAATAGNVLAFDSHSSSWKQVIRTPTTDDCITALVSRSDSPRYLYAVTDAGQLFVYDSHTKQWSDNENFASLPGYYVAAIPGRILSSCGEV